MEASQLPASHMRGVCTQVNGCMENVVWLEVFFSQLELTPTATLTFNLSLANVKLSLSVRNPNFYHSLGEFVRLTRKIWKSVRTEMDRKM